MSLEYQVYALEIVIGLMLAAKVVMAMQIRDQSKKIKRMRGR
jgi:hypothetical protein